MQKKMKKITDRVVREKSVLQPIGFTYVDIARRFDLDKKNVGALASASKSFAQTQRRQ